MNSTAEDEVFAQIGIITFSVWMGLTMLFACFVGFFVCTAAIDDNEFPSYVGLVFLTKPIELFLFLYTQNGKWANPKLYFVLFYWLVVWFPYFLSVVVGVFLLPLACKEIRRQEFGLVRYLNYLDKLVNIFKLVSIPVGFVLFVALWVLVGIDEPRVNGKEEEEIISFVLLGTLYITLEIAFRVFRTPIYAITTGSVDTLFVLSAGVLITQGIFLLVHLLGNTELMILFMLFTIFPIGTLNMFVLYGMKNSLDKVHFYKKESTDRLPLIVNSVYKLSSRNNVRTNRRWTTSQQNF